MTHETPVLALAALLLLAGAPFGGMRAWAFEAFKEGKAKFAATASAYAISAGAATVANYSDGVAVFVKGKGGLMADASLGGQSFTFEPLPGN